jgi:[ribosomal protein S18]-alanine N-acetyltransferase
MIAELHARSFARGWSADECAALLADRHVLGLVALARSFFGTRPVGFALVREAAGEAEILSIGVVPDARGRGAGWALLAAAVDRLRLRGISDLFLEVDESNLPALALYRAFGFRERGRRQSYYRSGEGAPAAALVLHLGL